MQLGVDKSGFRIVEVTKDKITHKYYELDNVPNNLSSCQWNKQIVYFSNVLVFII